jgi:hypothetical protein
MGRLNTFRDIQVKDIRQDAGRIAVEQLVHKVLHEAVGFSCAGALYRAYLTDTEYQAVMFVSCFFYIGIGTWKL